MKKAKNPTDGSNKIKAKTKKVTTFRKPQLDLDLAQLRELGKIHCTFQEIAAVVGCSYHTIRLHYKEIIEEGREQGKASLRHAQYQKAMEGNPAMLIWLGKHILNQRDEIKLSTVEPEARALLRKLEEVSPSGFTALTTDVKLIDMQKDKENPSEYK